MKTEQALRDPAMQAKANALADTIMRECGYEGQALILAKAVREMIGAAILASAMQTIELTQTEEH